jgi:transcriptional regulator with XRE-family HTH domain
MKKGWTIKEAAKCAGVSVDTWARWEQTNSLDVAAGRLSAAATVFNLDVEDILL